MPVVIPLRAEVCQMSEKQSEPKSDKEQNMQHEAKERIEANVRRTSQLREDREKEKQASAS